MIGTAGGECVLGSHGTPSVRVAWPAIQAAAPEVVVFMPCGYDLAGAAEEARALIDHPELAATRAFFAVDASAYFSRPGPRLVDGVELLAGALHPGSISVREQPGIVQLR